MNGGLRRCFSRLLAGRGRCEEPEGGCVVANPIVERQHVYVRQQIPNGQCGGEVNGVKRPDRLVRKRPAGSVNDLGVDAVERPMGGGGVDDRLQPERIGRAYASGDGGPAKGPIAFNECQVGRMDSFGGRQPRPGTLAALFVEKPRATTALVSSVQVHRSPRTSSSSSRTTREGRRRDECG